MVSTKAQMLWLKKQTKQNSWREKNLKSSWVFVETNHHIQCGGGGIELIVVV
jgi:hypothetical protein